MKKLLTLALALIMILSLAACGAKDSESTTSGSTTPDSTDSGPKERKHVVYWSMWNENEPQGAVLKQAAEQFAKDTNIDVEIVFQGRNISQVLVSAIEAGTQIDIFDSPTAALAYEKQGLVLEDLVKQKYPSTGDKPYNEAVNESMLNIMRDETKSGKLVSIPYLPFCFAILYNKDHFADAGITEVPTTWDEFMDACEKLKAKGYVPMTTDDAYATTLLSIYMNRAKGMEFVQENLMDHRDKILDDPAFLDMAKNFETMAKKGYIDENAWSNVYPAGQIDLGSGKVSMYYNGSWLPNEIKSTTGPDFNWGMMSFPEVPGGVGKNTEIAMGAQEFMISNKTKVAEEAFQFIAYVTTGTWDEKLATESMQVPMGKGAHWPKELADGEKLFATVTKSIIYGLNSDPEFNAKLQSAFKNLLGGKTTAEEFVAEVKK